MHMRKAIEKKLPKQEINFNRLLLTYYIKPQPKTAIPLTSPSPRFLTWLRTTGDQSIAEN